MTTPTGSMTLTRFFDSVLSAIEFGKIEQGISLLMGFFDAVHMNQGSLFEARQELKRHVLHQMLLQEPIYAQAATRPWDSAGLIDMASRSPPIEPISTTGRRLFEATKGLPLIRALCQRRANANQKLERAWKDGLRICLITQDSSGGNAALPGRDMSNVTIINCEAQDWVNFASIPEKQFDFICLSDVADSLNTSALFSLMAQRQQLVSPAGTAIVSAVNPGHLGSGWREACLNWNPSTHDAPALQRAASNAGFSARTYSDESDCIIWAELRPQQFSMARGSKNHAY